MRHHSVSITSDGFAHSVAIDGLDLSLGIRSARLDLEAGSLPRLVVEPRVVEVQQLSMPRAEVILDRHVTDLLLALGWTPPDATRTQQGGQSA